MTNTTKLTRKTALVNALNYIPQNETELREKLAAMIAQEEKKNASPKKLTAQQEQNLGLCDVIADFLVTAESGFTISELIKNIPALNGMNPQRVSTLAYKLMEQGRAEKYTEKRRSYFRARVES